MLGAAGLAFTPSAPPAWAAAAADDLQTRTIRMGDLVRSSGSHLGMVLDADGETAVIIDDTGKAFDTDGALLAMVTLVMEAAPGSRIALPVSVTEAAARIAEAHDGEVVWTKLSDAHIMEVASSVDFAASPDGGFIWPTFLPAYDATATLVKLLDLLASTGRSLSGVRAGLPTVHVAREEIATPWEKKGAVMREMMERASDLDVVLVDGVKILHPDGWALVLPDPEEPVVHVWAEAGSDHEAFQLAAEYARRIAQIV
jgi:mannose-1-phosphate guanylyltransferase/phosphomannomutase